MSKRAAGGGGPGVSQLHIYYWILHSFPASFRDRFSEELLQVLSADLRLSRTDASPFRRAGRILENVADLIASAAYEHFTLWRNLMSRNSILQILGIALISFWVIIMSWGLGRNLTGLNVKDPFILILGESQSNIEVALMDAVMYFGPLLAFISFLLPVLRLKSHPGEGEWVQISIRQSSRSRLVLLLASGLLSALWLGLIMMNRLLGY